MSALPRFFLVVVVVDWSVLLACPAVLLPAAGDCEASCANVNAETPIVKPSTMDPANRRRTFAAAIFRSPQVVVPELLTKGRTKSDFWETQAVAPIGPLDEMATWMGSDCSNRRTAIFSWGILDGAHAKK